jgi:sulfonate transport system substrate-binding protein
LQALGVTIKWIEFPAGPQALEALNTGGIDFAFTGEAPPIFAQAARAEMTYVAAVPGNPKFEAFLVPQYSPIQRVVDLKGKKVALNKGSNGHYLLVKALAEAGLQYTDVQLVFLPPAEARAAFQGGSIDAWLIWEPFLSMARKDLQARVLRDGTGLVANRLFYLARRAFIKSNAVVLQAILEEFQKVDDWSTDHPTEVAQFLSHLQGIDAGLLAYIAREAKYGVELMNDAIVAEQQKIAATFTALTLIPKQLNVKEAVWFGEHRVTATQ